MSVHYDESLPGNRAFQTWCESWAAECIRVLKPGAYLLAFGGPRTAHRLVSGIEDAGFQLRDTMIWLFGGGYPKSWNLCRCEQPVAARQDQHGWPICDGCGGRIGLGTALKPAWEPIILARKPLGRTVIQNVELHGTGALNIDGCRLPPDNAGISRWPPNVALDGDAATPLGERARFFYCPKASPAERHAGLEGMPERTPLVKPRDDLTAEQLAWLLSELAAHGVAL